MKTFATVCQQCSFLRSYGDDLPSLGIGFDKAKQIEPCNACGTGEMKMVSVELETFCEECSRHKSRCKCFSEERKKGLTKEDLVAAMKEVKKG